MKRIVRKKRLSDRKPIVISGKRGLVTRKNIKRVIDRWNKQKGFVVESHEKIVRDAKTKGQYYNATATQVARRFVLRDLLKPVERLGLDIRQKKLLEKIILDRPQKIPNTNIDLRPNTSLLTLELINSLGDKKVSHLFDVVLKRSMAIKKLADKEVKSRKIPSDVFVNVYSTVWAAQSELEMDLKSKKNFFNKVTDHITQRKGDLTVLKNSDVPNKEYYLKKLNQQIRRASIERVRFQMENKLTLQVSKQH